MRWRELCAEADRLSTRSQGLRAKARTLWLQEQELEGMDPDEALKAQAFDLLEGCDDER